MYHFDPQDFPCSPGVYLMKGGQGKILYVGKAKSLRARLSSYFRADSGHSAKTRALVTRVAAVDVLLTATEKEALLLESSLIKKHRPRYNVVLKDDKQYILFKLDKNAAYPRLTFTRRVERDGAAYFGPFTSAAAARRTWKEIGRAFPLRKCSDIALANRVRPCLFQHIGQCLAPCVNNVPREDYMELVRRVEAFLSGRSAELLRGLEREMLAASEALDFERAAKLRDLIRAVKKTVEGQAAVLPDPVDLDVIGLSAGQPMDNDDARREDGEAPGGLGASVLFVRQGRLLDKRDFFWPGLDFSDAGEAVRGVLGQFYRPESFVPPRILVPEEVVSPVEANDAAGEWELAAEALSDLRGAPVKVSAPRGKNERKLMELAVVNAARAFAERGREADFAAMSGRLAKALRLAEPPRRIEVVDVSHLGGQEVRVGCVVFEDGRPKKSDYRLYAFPELQGTSDDYLALASFVPRRLSGGAPFPDLLLIDGGKGQIRAVERAMEVAGRAGLFPLASIAKSGRSASDMEDRVFLPGRKNPVNLAPGSPELLFLQRLRDAAHSFCLGGQRRARRKAALQSGIAGLPGVGPKTARVLFETFGSVPAMRAATLEELARLRGFGIKKAARISELLAGLPPDDVSSGEGGDAASDADHPGPDESVSS
ncbi:MAG: excinuclease ABC subunit UvrC [Thermodesulfobacteriota bacterium]